MKCKRCSEEIPKNTEAYYKANVYCQFCQKKLVRESKYKIPLPRVYSYEKWFGRK